MKIVFYMLVLGVLISSCDFSSPSKSEKKFKKNFEYANESTPLFPNYNTLKADSLNQVAISFWTEGDYEKALQLSNLAYEKSENENNKEVLAMVLNTIGLIQWRLGNNEDAMTSYTQAGNIAKEIEMFRLLGLTHTNRGLILKEEHKFDAAFFQNNEAIRIFKSIREYRDLAIALNNQGQIFKNKKVNDSAQVYYLEALKYYGKVDYKDGEAATYYNLSDVYLKEGKKREALEAIQKSLDISISIERKLRICDAYKKLSEVYETFNEKDSALKYFKLYEKEHTDILESNQSKVLAEYQAKMGSKVKNLQIENLQKEQELTKNRNLFIGLMGLSVILVSVFFVYRHFQKMHFNKKNLELELTNSNKILLVKEQALKNYILDLSKKNEIIDLLQQEISINTPLSEKDKDVANLLQQKILTEEDWNTFKNKFNNIYPKFFPRVQQVPTSLTEGEIRFLVLLHLELTSKEMAKILGISPQSVRVTKMRLKKKLKQDGFETVEAFLVSLMT